MVGHTSVWMFFVYGLAVFVLEPLHSRIADYNWFTRGMIWMTLIFAIEFLTGMAFKVIGIEAWHYTGRFAILGVIRLDYAPLWFGVGLIFEKIHNVLLAYNVGIK